MSQVPYPPPISDIPSFASIEQTSNAPRMVRLLGVSVAIHIAAFFLLILIAPHLPETRATRQIVEFRRKAIELVAPTAPLTQKEANRSKLSENFTVESIQRHEAPSNTPSPGAAPRPAVIPKAQNRSSQPGPQPKTVLPDVPDLNLAQGQPQGPPPGLGVPAPPVAPQPAPEKPKLAFENPGAQLGVSGQRGIVPKASTSVEEAVRGSMRSGGGVTVGDVDEGISAPMPGMRPSPNGGKLGSSLELLSDSQGADFRPYLTKVLSAVRRNWFAIIPESARMGRQGRVLVRFTINKDGTVGNFQITGQSGTEAFDRAAVAGISASVPFPPLPVEFKGGWVRLQLSFLYNIQR